MLLFTNFLFPVAHNLPRILYNRWNAALVFQKITFVDLKI
jgi:hypothetical protein